MWKPRGRTYRQPGGVQLDVVSSGIDWFELRGQVQYDGQRASLPALLTALERGESFVSLGDGTIGLLPEEWLRKHAAIARLGSREGDGIRFKRTQVALLDALLAAQPEAHWDETFARARTELQAFEGIRPLDPPATFTGTLRGYQREARLADAPAALRLWRLPRDDMGLGKTVMVLALWLHVARFTGTATAFHRSWSRTLGGLQLAAEAARFTPGLRVLEHAAPDVPPCAAASPITTW